MKKILLFCLASLFIISCNLMKKPPATDAADFALEWEFLGNQFHTGYSSAVFTLTNKSKHHLGNSGWEIYFSPMGRGVIPESVTAPVQIQHVNGDLVVIRPDLEFSLDPGEKVVIAYNKPGKVLASTKLHLLTIRNFTVI